MHKVPGPSDGAATSVHEDNTRAAWGLVVCVGSEVEEPTQEVITSALTTMSPFVMTRIEQTIRNHYPFVRACD